MLASRLPANTLQGMMDLCCAALCDDGDTFYSQRVYDLFPQMATTNSGWALHVADAGGVFGGEISGGISNDSNYIEWTVYVPSGNYKVKVLYWGGGTVGKADLTIDGGPVVDTIDTYNGGNNAKWTSAQFTVTEGSHTIRFTKNGKNASSAGYTTYFQHCQLIKQDATSALASVANVPHVIDIPVVFADSATNWNTLSMSTSFMFGTVLQSSSAQNATITYSFWAPKGAFTLSLMHRKTSQAGIYSVSVDGGSIGTIDGYNSSTVNNALDTTLTGTLASTGIHTITFTMATKNGSSTNYYGSILHIQIRMTSITEPLAADLAPEVALFWPVFNEGNSFWGTIIVSAGSGYYYRIEGSGLQNQEITLSSNTVLRPGTYQLDIFGSKGNYGIFHLLLDASDVGTVDSYNGGGAITNQIMQIAGVTFSGVSPHTIKLKMATKNASAGTYHGVITLARLIRTGS